MLLRLMSAEQAVSLAVSHSAIHSNCWMMGCFWPRLLLSWEQYGIYEDAHILHLDVSQGGVDRSAGAIVQLVHDDAGDEDEGSHHNRGLVVQQHRQNVPKHHLDLLKALECPQLRCLVSDWFDRTRLNNWSLDTNLATIF